MPTYKTISLGNETDFVSQVINENALLSRFSGDSATVLSIAKNKSLPYVGGILAGAKAIDGSFLFSSKKGTYTNVAENVITLMSSDNSPFTEGITVVIIKLTAATLIGNLPLNSNLKQFDLSKELKEEAMFYLKNIVEQIKHSDDFIGALNYTSLEKTENSIYLALDVDKTTLPVEYFQLDPINTVDSVETTYQTSVLQLTGVTIPNEQIAFGYLYFSTQEPTNFIGSFYSEQVFKLVNGNTLPQVLDSVVNLINNATLSLDSPSPIKANLLASPEVVVLNEQLEVVKKLDAYPDESDEYNQKRLSFILNKEVGRIKFSARYSNEKITNDLILISFYSGLKSNLAQLLFPGLTCSYSGVFNIATVYTAGQVVDYNFKTYVALEETIAGDLPTTSKWSQIDRGTQLLETRKFLNNYVRGLVYGLNTSFYRTLLSKGSVSTVVKLENGKVSSPVSSTTDKKKENYKVDTFYFKVLPDTILTGDLKYNVSFANFIERFTEEETFGEYTISLDGLTTGVQVAEEFTKSFYEKGLITQILGVLVLPNAVQITNFHDFRKEMRGVIDIVDLPEGLEIATGTSLELKTIYNSSPRSVLIEDEMSSTVTSKVIDNNRIYSAAVVSKGKKSDKLQAVEDKIARLNAY